MLKNIFYILLLLAFCLLTFNRSNAQSQYIILPTHTITTPSIVPIGAIPAYYNGGFAGEAGTQRVASYSYFNHYKTYGISKSARYQNIISYDNFFKKARLGLGFIIGQDFFRSSGTTFIYSVLADYSTSNSFATVSLSPKFSFKGKYTFAPFVDFTVDHYHSYGYGLFYPNNSPVPYDSSYNSTAYKTGFLINSSNAYIGFSVSPLFHYSSSSISSPSTLNYSLQGGLLFSAPRIPNFQLLHSC